MDDDFNGKFRLERTREYLRKKTMSNITPAIIFSKLKKRKVNINVVLTSHVLLICLKSMLHYEVNYPDKNMLSHTLILIAGWRLAGGWLASFKNIWQFRIVKVIRGLNSG